MCLQLFFEDNVDDDKYCGHLFGLGASHVQNGSSSGYEGYGPPTGQAPHIVNAPSSSSNPTIYHVNNAGDGSGNANSVTGS